MKRLISQNGVTIDTVKNFKVFECRNCGAIFESNEYEVEGFITAEKSNNPNAYVTVGKIKLTDTCFTCMRECEVIEDKIEN